MWLAAQIVQGLLLLYMPFWQFLSSQVGDARPGAYGALMLLIAASCLIPVAMETWRSANRLLGVGTGAAVFFGLIGALATLAYSSVFLAVLWSTSNSYIFVLALFLGITGRNAAGAIRRRTTLQSTVSPTSMVFTTIRPSRTTLPPWFYISHFLDVARSQSRRPLPAWFYIRHFLNRRNGR